MQGQELKAMELLEVITVIMSNHPKDTIIDVSFEEE